MGGGSGFVPESTCMGSKVLGHACTLSGVSQYEVNHLYLWTYWDSAWAAQEHLGIRVTRKCVA